MHYPRILVVDASAVVRNGMCCNAALCEPPQFNVLRRVFDVRSFRLLAFENSVETSRQVWISRLESI